jgi:dTDP-4-dehydrorhamnose reductase
MWLVVGGDSEIGAALYGRLATLDRSTAATTRRPEHVGPQRPFLDLSARLDGWTPPKGTRTACITAAVAHLADCAADPAASAAINVTGTLALTEQLIARGIHVLFLSSNHVFDGTRPHVPADAPTCPVSEYGRQKARTEAALAAHMERGAPIAILRLAKVLSPTMLLARGWVEALAAGRRVPAFYDMTMAPTPIDMVVDAISALMRDEARGIFQLTGPRDASYVDIARYLALRIGTDPALVEPTSAARIMPAGATPLNTTLDITALRNAYGLVVPDVWETLEPFVNLAAR